MLRNFRVKLRFHTVDTSVGESYYSHSSSCFRRPTKMSNRGVFVCGQRMKEKSTVRLELGKRTRMTREITVRVFDIIGGPLCVSTCDGQRLYDEIAPLLRTGTPVVLSFERIEIVIAAFLDAAVGQLYGELPDESIRALLSFAISDDDR